MAELLIGTDPELFVRDIDAGEFISAHDLVPGSKRSPHLVRCGAVQPDGVAAEFNIFPAPNAKAFVNNHKVVLKQLHEIINWGDRNVELVPIPTVVFDKEYWKTIPREAKILGCEPDFSPYTGKPNSKPQVRTTMRTAGFHIHVGWGDGFQPSNQEHFSKCMMVARQLDAVIFGPSLLWDSDDTRRQMYGSLGAFRPKRYGMEWRPLSNAALQNEEILKWIFEATKTSVELLFNEGVELSYNEFANPVERNEYYHMKYGIPEIPGFLVGEEYVGEKINDLGEAA